MNYIFDHPARIAALTAQHLALVALALVCALAIALPVGVADRASLASARLGARRARRDLHDPKPRAARALGRSCGSGSGADLHRARCLRAVHARAQHRHRHFSPSIPRSAMPRSVLECRRCSCVARVEIPQALRVMIGGVRITTVTMISLATLGGYVGAGGPWIADLSRTHPPSQRRNRRRIARCSRASGRRRRSATAGRTDRSEFKRARENKRENRSARIAPASCALEAAALQSSRRSPRHRICTMIRYGCVRRERTSISVPIASMCTRCAHCRFEERFDAAAPFVVARHMLERAQIERAAKLAIDARRERSYRTRRSRPSDRCRHARVSRGPFCDRRRAAGRLPGAARGQSARSASAPRAADNSRCSSPSASRGRGARSAANPTRARRNNRPRKPRIARPSYRSDQCGRRRAQRVARKYRSGCSAAVGCTRSASSIKMRVFCALPLPEFEKLERAAEHAHDLPAPLFENRGLSSRSNNIPGAA